MKNTKDSQSHTPEHSKRKDLIEMETASIVYDSIIIDLRRIHRFLKKVKYPLGVLSMHTFQPGTPVNHNGRPFQHIPFQFSFIHKYEPSAEPMEYEYLADPGMDPGKEVVEWIIEAGRDSKTIIVANKPIVQMRLRELVQCFPEKVRHIKAMERKLVDIMDPFKSRAYYHPQLACGGDLESILRDISDSKYAKWSIPDHQTVTDAYSQYLNIPSPEKEAEIFSLLIDYSKSLTLGILYLYRDLEFTFGEGFKPNQSCFI